MSDLWKARLADADDASLRRGFDAAYRCLYCDAQSRDWDAARAHLRQAHGSALDALLALDKRYTGFTDTQKALIRQWKDGAADGDIAVARGVSVSTLRNQRFALREREREARLLLATLSLAGLCAGQRPRRGGEGAGENGVDRFFRNGRLISMPSRAQKLRGVMERMAALFDVGRMYSEGEVRELLAPVWPDHALVRRYLVDAQLLRRTVDGGTYWREDAPALSTQPTVEEVSSSMAIDKKAAKQAYKNTIPSMGIYCLRDGQSGRCVIAGSRNMDNIMGRFRFLMGGGGAQPGGPFSDPQLYTDYRDHPDSFALEVLESVDVEKCATYEEAADKLEALLKTALPRYADWPQYIQK